MRRSIPLVVALSGLSATPAPAGTVTLSPIADNSIYEGPDSAASNGAGTGLFTGVNRQSERRRALLRFEFSAIPPGSIVTSASLSMTVTRNIAGAPTVGVHRLTTAWGEGSADAGDPGGQGTAAGAGDATWFFSQFGSVAWTNPGGDFAPFASAMEDVTGYGTFIWNDGGLVSDVQAWIDGTAHNYGWILIGDASGSFNAKRFASREHGVPAERPTLIVEYAPPLCTGDYDQSGTVDFADITWVLAQFGNPHTFADITVVLANWGSAC